VVLKGKKRKGKGKSEGKKEKGIVQREQGTV
jgi:hypothetical protein